MVTITVILAAVIASFVLGIGDQQSTTPTASISSDYTEIHDGTSGELKFTHDSGDTIRADEVHIRGQNGSNGQGGSFNDPWSDFADDTVDVTGAGDPAEQGSVSGEISSQSAITSGDYIEFPVGSNAEIQVVYDAQDGDTTATLATFEGPDA